MDCPKDADTTKTPCRKVCPTGLPFICTRPRGHKGKHHAHGGKHHAHGGRCFAVWGKVAAYELCGENVPVKSSCPKDANTTRTNDVVSKRCCPYLLRAGKGRYFKCTRINFHKGKHHAHDEGGKCLAVWGG